MKRTNEMLKINLFIIFILFQLMPIMANGQVESDGTSNHLKNQVSVMHLQSFYDNNKKSTSISSLEYMRRFENKSTVIGRVNYSNRNDLKGMQFEAETYLMHSPSYYSFASFGVANNEAFPQFKAAYSLNRNFKKGWEGELGYRYLRAEEMDIHSAIWGVGKYVGNYWLNLKGYVIYDNGDYHHAYRLTGRYYLNDELDYLTMIVATGTSPDDRSRNFSYSNFGSFISKSVALGYKKSFKNNYGASLISTWNNQKISDSKYLNQFDFYISLSKSF